MWSIRDSMCCSPSMVAVSISPRHDNNVGDMLMMNDLDVNDDVDVNDVDVDDVDDVDGWMQLFLCGAVFRIE